MSAVPRSAVVRGTVIIVRTPAEMRKVAESTKKATCAPQSAMENPASVGPIKKPQLYPGGILREEAEVDAMRPDGRPKRITASTP